MKNEVFLSHGPDPIGAILGVPEPLRFNRFQAANGVGGLARERDNGSRLEILAVHTENERKGHFRSFIDHCKSHYQTICVFDIFNPIVEQALERYGFKPTIEPQWDGEMSPGMRWDKQTP